ncbi:Uncharacterised protein [Neisseria animaloris]|uniref:DUF4442 domain-containing protein n=1 Tax=Neisseria animaloris TaxID=326522 RepID=UPI000A19448B|nr:DUF4442 domain-containing protein [Neisseria animaloris]OSI06755.1 DUF4442 domain-containing protein [Neisseria animaloris]VEH86861.1 Uncharacterised protein [Neisseria animaloris]
MLRLRSRFHNAAQARFLLNLWPPLLFSGIRITELSPDFRHMKATLKNWPGTRNAHGTQFGGSLFAMTDVTYSVMLNGLMGKRYFVWDKSAHIDFIKPGRSAVYIECTLTDEMLQDIYKHTQTGDKYLPEMKVHIFDKHGDTVAIVTRVLYVRLKPAFRPKQQEN